MDLIFEYLIVFILVFVANIAFLVRNSDINKDKFILLAIVYALIVFILINLASILNIQESVVEFIPYVLGLVAFVMLILTIRYVGFGKNYDILNDRLVFYGTIFASLISVAVLALGLNTENPFLSGIELAILSFVVMVLVYKISKIFKKAERPYYAVIGEFMFLEFILLLILALTFNSVRNLDYSMFGSFLILTPTYKVLYMVLAIVIVLVLGVLYNERMLKKLNRK